MASTRNTLEEFSLNVHESMGLRRVERSAKLSPVASAKDIGRVPLRTVGKVEVDRVMPDPQQPRLQFDLEDIQHLAESICSHGQLHPIRVRWSETAGKWLIISGERRWRATQQAGLPTIDCFFVEGDVSESELKEQQLVENLLREDLKPTEEAKAYQSLMELNDWNGKQIAEALRVSTSRVSRALGLLDLPESVQRQVDAGELPKSYAYEISKLSNKQAQSEIAMLAVDGQLSNAKTLKQVNQRRGKKAPKPRTGLQQTFVAECGIKVSVSSKSKTNYHEVEQALLEALDEVRLRINNNVHIF